ncbi:hypothetical protein GPECTOR_36g117 [Gonium pectorale]|uniref:Uncharacterized protein n=1 Tax=Gonium pectorale TaxID=33097 RepID=A0A150GBQ4_GONPE|nr:hypothetical protein GPECTOR_36g117 [Gonium pectorale]|eukprot:KXZ47264.1 hypothetical protein GPECTOR_36g117 [Gonium pectorale]
MGGCSQCQEHEEFSRYCADTGFKELLRCTTNEKRADGWPVVLTYPYPPDVHIDDEEEPDTEAGALAGTGEAASGAGVGRPGSGLIRVVRSCTENTVEAHVQALAADMAEAEARSGGQLGGHMELFNFELIMVLLLGLALPVVYWRKIRIRHL